MKKLVKIILKSLLIILLVILIAIITIPYLFKNQLLEKVKKEINKNVNAKVEFADFKVGLIKHFPNLTVSLKDLTVTGIDSFENDTLVSFKSFDAALDLLSLIKKDGIDVKLVSLNKPSIYAKVMEDEKVSWDIMKESDTEKIEEPDTVISETPDFNVKLKKFEIVDATIVYEDLKTNMFASLRNFNFMLSGNMSADNTDLALNSTIEDIDFKYAGMQYARDAIFDMSAEIGADMKNMIFTFNDNSISFNELEISFDGKVENFIPYIFEDQTVKGKLELASSNLDINELIPETEEEAEVEETDSVALSIIKVPENIDFEFSSKLDHIEYGDLVIDNTRGKIIVNGGKILLDGLQMDLLQGSMGMSGEYNTTDMTKPNIVFDLDVSRIDIQSAFNAFNTVEKLMPAAEGLNGNVSTKLKYESLLGKDMMPVIETINGFGKLQSESIQVIKSGTFDKISSALKLKKDLSNTFKDLNISFKIIDGRIYVEPFKAELGSIGMVIGGDQGIDQTMNYTVKMSVPRECWLRLQQKKQQKK